MACVTAISNQKGGVGKTTLSLNLGKGLAALGHRVLLIDNDPQANLTAGVLDDPSLLTAHTHGLYNSGDVTPQMVEQNLFLIGADIHLATVAEQTFEVIFDFKESLQGLQDSFDFILIDCLPSFGYLSAAAHIAADNVLIPTKLAMFGLDGLRDLFKSLSNTKRRHNKALTPLGIVFNHVEGAKTRFENEIEDSLVNEYGNLIFNTQITRSIKVEESHAFNQSMMQYNKNSKQAHQFNALVEEYIDRVGH